MTVYIDKSGGGWSSRTGDWVSKDDPLEVKPESLDVSVSKLAVGDIVLLHDYNSKTIRSATISGIEASVHPKYGSKGWKVTTIDGVGKVEVHDCSHGSRFARQCSVATKENAEERGRNISLRRDIQRLEGKVEDLIRDMDWFLKNGGKNPKMPSYKGQVEQFLKDLAAMYDDVGNDLGLPTRAQRKAEKDAKKKK